MPRLDKGLCPTWPELALPLDQSFSVIFARSTTFLVQHPLFPHTPPKLKLEDSSSRLDYFAGHACEHKIDNRILLGLCYAFVHGMVTTRIRAIGVALLISTAILHSKVSRVVLGKFLEEGGGAQSSICSRVPSLFSV